jgi:hypothetical protein
MAWLRSVRRVKYNIFYSLGINFKASSILINGPL